MIKRILITSGKGGVGKTTVTAHLGAAISMTGKRTLLLDGDTGLRNLDAALGLQDRIIFDALDIASGRVDIQGGVIKHPLYDGLDFIAAPQAGAFAPGRMQRLCFMLENIYDVILIDCPAGIDEGFSNCASCAQAALIIITPDVASVRDAIKTREKLSAMNIPRQYAVVNMVRKRMARAGGCMSASEAIELSGLPLLGTINQSAKLISVVNRGQMPLKGREAHEFAKLARDLLENIYAGAGGEQEVV